MGDRAHAVIIDGNSTVYLYTHWTGTELPDTVRQALTVAKNGDRLTDGPYLARIVFAHMIAGSRVTDTTGFGISSQPCEDTSRDVTIDVDNGHVRKGNGAWVSITDFIQDCQRER